MEVDDVLKVSTCTTLLLGAVVPLSVLETDGVSLGTVLGVLVTVEDGALVGRSSGSMLGSGVSPVGRSRASALGKGVDPVGPSLGALLGALLGAAFMVSEGASVIGSLGYWVVFDKLGSTVEFADRAGD